MACILYNISLSIWIIGWCSSWSVWLLFLQDVLQVSSGWAVLRAVCVRTGARVTLWAAAASVPAAGRDRPVNWVSDCDLYTSFTLRETPGIFSRSVRGLRFDTSKHSMQYVIHFILIDSRKCWRGSWPHRIHLLERKPLLPVWKLWICFYMLFLAFCLVGKEDWKWSGYSMSQARFELASSATALKLNVLNVMDLICWPLLVTVSREGK